ncbi:hypothetical protein Tco_0435916 [Tanacetum coccineum]
MADLLQDNLALGERLDNHGTRLYSLENLDIPHKVSQVVDEIVTDAVDWAMQAPLPARFRDLPTVDIKEILQQRMFEDDTYKANNEEARKKRRKRRDTPRSPCGSPPSQPPPPPPLAGVSGAPAPSSSKTTASAQQSMAWTTSDTRYESTGIAWVQELSSSDDLMHDDSAPDEHVQVSDDQDFENDHTPAAADSRKDWWKQLPEEERPATPEPAWTIPSSHKLDLENNWASTLATTYEPPAKNSLLEKIGDMTTFLNSYCQRMNKTMLTQADFEGLAYEVVKAFYPDVIHLQINVNRPLPLGGPPGHVTIQTEFFFNKDLEYLRYGSKGSCLALLISKIKAASYPDFGLELLVPEQMWIDDVCTYDVRTHMWIFSVVRIKANSRYRYAYLSEIVLRRADHQEHKIAEKDFKNLQAVDPKLSDSTAGYEFKHDYNIIESPRAVIFPVNNNERKIMRFNEIYKFSDGMLTCILETLDYRVKEFKIKRLNPGMNTRFWTEKEVTRSKEFIIAIERRLKTRRIYQNIECFVGGRVRDIDYMHL